MKGVRHNTQLSNIVNTSVNSHADYLFKLTFNIGSDHMGLTFQKLHPSPSVKAQAQDMVDAFSSFGEVMEAKVPIDSSQVVEQDKLNLCSRNLWCIEPHDSHD